MSIRYTEHTQIKRPIAPPIDLNQGRLDMVRAAAAGGFVLAALLVAGVLTWAAVGAYEAALWVVVVFAGAALVACVVFAAIVLVVAVAEWLDHRRRVQEWHGESLEAYRKLGAETMEHVTEYTWSSNNIAHVLLSAVYVQLLIDGGTDTPYTVRKLEGPVFFKNRRVGDISRLTAEELGRRFADLGLIEGRSERNAGEWVPRSHDQVVELVLKNWKYRE